MRRREFLAATAASALYPSLGRKPATAAEPDAVNPCLTRVCPQYLITPDEATAWHALKDEQGPCFSGNPAWRHYMEFVESKLKEYGARDVTRNAWTYDRWHTTEWPDDSQWSLTSNGKRIKLASYGAYSGSTGAEGVTGELMLYNAAELLRDNPVNPSALLEGKIVVFRPDLTQEQANILENFDYESPPKIESYPEPGKPVASDIRSVSGPIWAQMLATRVFLGALEKSKAAGCVIVFDSALDQLAGHYTFPVPEPYDIPTLYVDRAAGAVVLADAKAHAKATLTLRAEATPTETWQLIGYLPGRNYGTPQDEMILYTTHSDGPSISQDNGPLGMLAIAKYFSNIPQAQRPRTLMFYFDNRHFMPGREEAFLKEDWFARHPESRDRVVAVMGIEHLGQIEFVEEGQGIRPSGRYDLSNLWVTNNDRMLGMAVKAVADNQLPGVAVRVPGRPGMNGRSQGPWYGLGAAANRLGKPGFATMGSMGMYWTTASRLDRFDARLFCRQIATFAQLTGELMAGDLRELQSARSESAGAN